MADPPPLHHRSGAEPRPGYLEGPHPARFDQRTEGFAESLGAHDLAIAAGEAGYVDPRTGLFVLTAAYLVDRGYCCDQGCRHCPWFVG